MSQQKLPKRAINLNYFFKTLSLLTILFFASVGARGAGEVDPTFNINVGRFSSVRVNAVALQPDGKVLIVGNFLFVDDLMRNGIARLNPDGSGDPSFNSGGISGTVEAIAVQPDGKILIGGNFTTVGGASRANIARLNADGSLDTAFNAAVSGTVNVIVIQPGGKILVGGNFSVTTNTSVLTNLVRLNEDGSIDSSFAAVNPPSTVFDIAVQPDGKIITGGYNGSVFRLNQNGSIDSTFSILGTTGGDVRAIAIQPDGKIIVVGAFTSYGGVTQGRIARLNPDGSLDATFNTNNPGVGVPFDDARVNDVAITADGKIIIVGSFTRYNNVFVPNYARLNADGTLDTSFNYNNAFFSATNTKVIVQSDGKIILSSFYPFASTNRPLVRLNIDGTIDSTFTANVAFLTGAQVNVLHVQPDGKILVGGNFLAVNARQRNQLMRLNADGTFDNSFVPNVNIGTGGGAVYAIATQSDGEILVGGHLGIELQRLNPDGSRDTTFSFTSVANRIIYTLKIQPDGKILIAGNGSSVLRLNANGTIDSSFTNANVGGVIYKMALQPDGKILIAGDFLQVAGFSRGRIARLNSDGTLDTTFNPPFGANNSISNVVLQNDGKVLIGGVFTTINGVNRGFFARLNSDGTLDTSFAPLVNAPVYGILLAPDGKILIGGSFTAINGVLRSRYARLNADGSLDPSFNVGNGADSTVLDFAFQNDGKVIIGGAFTQIDNQMHLGLARLINSNPARRTLFDFDGDGKADFAVVRPSNYFWYILNSSNNSFTAMQFGVAGDQIAPADYDGDGKTDIAVFRENVPGAGGRAYFYIQQSSSNTFRPEQFGAVGDKPVAADFDGDGKADLAVYRDGSLTGGQSYFFYRPSSQPGVDFRTIAWGVTGDKPAAADYDGDGRQDPAVFRPSNGHWYILRSSDNQFLPIRFGLAEDVPTPADFNGDGRADIAVFRPSNGTWYTSTDPATNYGAVQWGISTDVPVAADYDGDGRTDVAVFRPGNGVWYVLRSTSGFLGIQWGATNDRPAPAAYVR